MLGGKEVIIPGMANNLYVAFAKLFPHMIMNNFANMLDPDPKAK
jgi:hypothetical protein